MICRPGVVRITSERRFVKGLGYVRADATPRRTQYAIAQAKHGHGSGKSVVLAKMPYI
ncbi:hypothetical protein FRC07_014246, partial [Ceratobasidium sp. 392]